jgi:5S rRNA maturation endonuclease (ribonuclease M5)
MGNCHLKYYGVNQMSVIETILSNYLPIKKETEGFSIPCIFCKEENKDKRIYFYPSGVTKCFRCFDTKDRKWSNSWKCLNDILKKLGVDKRSIQTFNGGIQYVDYGKGISRSLGKYPLNDLISSKDSEKATKFLSGRNLDIDKVGKYVFEGAGGAVNGKLCVQLYPSGIQCRSFEIKDYRIFNTDHKNTVFCPDPITHVNDLFIVEGPYDNLNLFQFGYHAIATLGIHTSPYIKQIIAQKDPENIYLWFDNDKAGDAGFAKLTQFLISGFYDLYTIRTEKDPKHLSENDIHMAITTAEPIDIERIFR